MHRVTLADDLDICYATAGPDDGPAVLLVMGLGAQMIAWPPLLVDLLAAAGLRVITFDNRDVGESTWMCHLPTTPLSEILAGLAAGAVPPPSYTLSDMAGDGIGLLDHLGVASAHVVGASMGGMIAQRMAIGHADRVASLTSVMSTTGAADLPGPTPAATETLFSPSPVADRTAYVEAVLAKREVTGSPGLAVDLAWTRMVLGRCWDRGINPHGFLRQYHAIAADGDRTGALALLEVPAHVVHGVDDPLVPIEAGRATAAAIPGATLREVAGMGHDLPPAVCRILADDVVALVRRS